MDVAGPLYRTRERFVQQISILLTKVHRLAVWPCNSYRVGPAYDDIDLFASLTNDKCHYTCLR
jgi:hypothetical protein